MKPSKMMFRQIDPEHLWYVRVNFNYQDSGIYSYMDVAVQADCKCKAEEIAIERAKGVYTTKKGPAFTDQVIGGIHKLEVYGE